MKNFINQIIWFDLKRKNFLSIWWHQLLNLEKIKHGILEQLGNCNTLFVFQKKPRKDRYQKSNWLSESTDSNVPQPFRKFHENPPRTFWRIGETNNGRNVTMLCRDDNSADVADLPSSTVALGDRSSAVRWHRSICSRCSTAGWCRGFFLLRCEWLSVGHRQILINIKSSFRHRSQPCFSFSLLSLHTQQSWQAMVIVNDQITKIHTHLKTNLISTGNLKHNAQFKGGA